MSLRAFCQKRLSTISPERHRGGLLAVGIVTMDDLIAPLGNEIPEMANLVSER